MWSTTQTHICVDIGYVVVLHEHLSQRQFLVVIRHIKRRSFAAIRAGRRQEPSVSNSWEVGRKEGVESRRRNRDHEDQLVRRSLAFSSLVCLNFSTDELPVIQE